MHSMSPFTWHILPKSFNRTPNCLTSSSKLKRAVIEIIHQLNQQNLSGSKGLQKRKPVSHQVAVAERAQDEPMHSREPKLTRRQNRRCTDLGGAYSFSASHSRIRQCPVLAEVGRWISRINCPHSCVALLVLFFWSSHTVSGRWTSMPFSPAHGSNRYQSC